MNASGFAVLFLVTTSLFLFPGCTQKKDLKTLLEDEEEYWRFLITQGVPNTGTAREYTIIYVALSDTMSDNPVDSLIVLRSEFSGKKLGEVIDLLQGRGFSKDEAVLLSLPLTGSDNEWKAFIGHMVSIDDYVRTRLGYSSIPQRKADISQTYESSTEEKPMGQAQH